MSERLPGRTLERIALRLAPSETYERVLRPLIADLQFEHAHAPDGRMRLFVRLRHAAAYWFVLTRALAFGAVVGPAGDWSATWRCAAHVTAATAAISAVFVALQLPGIIRGVPQAARAYPFLLPSLLTAALPLGTLLAVACRSHAATPSRVHWRVAFAAAVVTFALAAWVTPRANQLSRERIFEVWSGIRVTGMPYDREMTLGQLSTRAALLRASGAEPYDLPRLDVEWHKKPALGVACLAFALVGAGIAATRWRRIWRGLAAFVFAAGLSITLMDAERAADAGRLAPMLAMWAPIAVLAAFGAVLTILAPRPAPASTDPVTS